MRNALILASEHRLSYRVLRCTARVFENVYILGTSSASLLAGSRMCSGYFKHSGESFTHDDIEAINALCRRLSIECVLPSDGHTTGFLAGIGDQLTVRTYPVPSAAVFNTLNNKGTFVALCAELDVPIPESRLFSSSVELLGSADAGSVRYPFVAKPVSRSGGCGVKKIDGKAAAQTIDYEPILVQDFVEGREICAFYLCWHGRILAEVAYHHEHETVHFVRCDELRRHATRIIEHVEFHGVIGFDVIEHADNSLAFLECNPRFWYNINFAMLAGLNFVEAGLFPEKVAAIRMVGEMRLPKIGSIASIGAAWRYGSVGWKVLRYYLTDLRQCLAERHRISTS